LRIFNNLTPFVPLSFEGEGEMRKRGASAPLRHPVFFAIPGRDLGG